MTALAPPPPPFAARERRAVKRRTVLDELTKRGDTATILHPVRILLISQMYPGPDDPDLGTFVAPLESALVARGHDVERAVLDRRSGGKRRYVELARDARAKARRFGPDVVYAHFLVPTGLAAALAARAPLVVTAHGRDVRNIGTILGVATATRFVVGRAAAVVCVSDYLRLELIAKLPEARHKVEVVSSGVDLERFTLAPPPPNGPRYLCIGALTVRKNVVRLASAFERLGEGTLAFAGDGPLRGALEGRERVELLGRIPHDEVPGAIATASVVCQPSLIEPLGQALLEAMACGRPVVATRIGGPPEFVPEDAGILVDPLDEGALADALRAAATLPVPSPAARAAAEAHDVKRQAERLEAILERAARDPRA
jgi:glycosyltransferase involved in cell wall biosynthesis